MIGSRAWIALMRRNMLYRRRYWISTCLEIALPIAFVGILIAIKNSVGDTAAELMEPTFPTADDVYVPLSFRDYTTMFQAERKCVENPTTIDGDYQEFEITGMPSWSYDWQVPFIHCDAVLCKEDGEDAQQYCEYSIIAVAAKSSSDEGGQNRAHDFSDWIYDDYPILTNQTAMPFSYDFVRYFESESELENYVEHSQYGKSDRPKVAMGIVWSDDSPTSYTYTIRNNQTFYNVPTVDDRNAAITSPDTARLFDHYAPNDESCEIFDGMPFLGPRESSCTGMYLYNGVLTMQKLIGDFILDDSGATAASPQFRVADNGIRLVPFPTKEYEEGGFFEDIAVFVPLLITLGLLYPVSSMISYVCREKELRQKELMKMMSVAESDIGWSWFISFFSLYFIVATLVTLVSAQLYTNSEVFYLWIFWILAFTALVVFTMFVSALSAKTTRTILIGLLLVFMGVFLTLAVDYQDGESGTIAILSLHPVAALSYGLFEIGRLEDQGVGVTSDTFSTTSNPSGYAFNNAIGNLIVDLAIWGFLTWYLNRIVTPDFGQAHPWYFPVSRDYWFPSSTQHGRMQGSDETDEAVNGVIPIEGVSDNLRANSSENVVVRHLKKQFGEKNAVDDLSLTMYNGQVTALLGHNGAGKTTTISMLTGSMASTSGGAEILGKDLHSQLGDVRSNLGICLQHDCLFPEMTVREHVQFFSRLKGLYSQMSHDEAEAHIDQIIKDVALFEKRNTFSKNLSGGMKRKLSVAMAFCGGSKVVLLDEPTSGMDPFSRRFTWNVIRQYRQNRIILLTTHFMDEADVLGDRIAIMAEGQLRCIGSPLFLKKYYGVGYQLTIEKQHDFVGSASPEEVIELDGQLTRLVTVNVKEASLLNNVGSELSFQLPVGEAARFAPMFEGLDRKIEEKKISSYGVGITTMEEVFLLVARGSEVGQSSRKMYRSSQRLSSTPFDHEDDSTENSARSQMNLENDNLFRAHVSALCSKRAAIFKRDKKAWCCTTILPSVFVLFGLLIFKFAIPDRAMDAVPLRLDDYNSDFKGQPRNPIHVNDLDNLFECQPGVCAYEGGNDPLFVERTGELYSVCGLHASVNPDTSSIPLCSLSETTGFMDTISESGVQVIQTESTTTGETSQALFDSANSYAASQYAAILYTHDDSSSLESGRSFNDVVLENCTGFIMNHGADYMPAEDCEAYTGIGYILQYNYTAYHVAPTYMGVATEGLARQALETDEFHIDATIHPLPLTDIEKKYVGGEDAFTAWFLLVLSFPFVCGSFATFVVTERQSKAKHLQTVTGVKPSGYWVSTFLWDTANYQLPLWIIVILFFAFDIEAFTTTEKDVVYGVLAAMILFGPAAAGFTYCMTNFFSNPSLCNVVMIISGFLIGMGGPMTVAILVMLGKNPADPRPNLVDIAFNLSWVLRLHPCFCLGRALYFAINVDVISWLYPGLDSVWTEEVLLYEIIFLAWESVAYLWLAIKLDIWSNNPSMMACWKTFIYTITCSRPKSPEVDITRALEEDSDVLDEEERVNQGGANSDMIVLDQLTKVYDNGKKAVNSMSLGVPPGQVFGLLGVNGAGKTTTMQMLTAEFPASSGDATLAGYSVSREPEKTRRRVGYCPQFDAHFPNMTGREHVELYATIKGIPSEFVKSTAAAKLAQVGLSKFDSDKLAATYSGGMKRRLSLACATIGDPQIVFLDECSTGVDPVARREIWELVSNMVAGDESGEGSTSVILTTHSMEECEALCPRIGIMANGRLRALGSAQHLKNKFGQGYQIEMKCKLVDKKDTDYESILAVLGEGILAQNAEFGADEVFFDLDDVKRSLTTLTGDAYLTSLVSEDNPTGYNIYKNATSETGIALDELAVFATAELRIRNVAEFVSSTYSTFVLRERQDLKVRYEVNSAGVKISSIFAAVEANKGHLKLDDYGVSQTSLEQVFNMHAAEAEKLKHGRNDG